MRVYRNHYSTEGGGSKGYSFHSSKADASKEAREARVRLGDQFEPLHEIAEPLEIAVSRDGIISFLNMFASHPNNG